MKSVKAIIPDANIVHYRDPIKSIEDYDLLLTSEEFWNRHENESQILIFQSDSLVLNGSERYCINLMDYYKYIGAPWDLARAEKYDRWVGNGGLSLRDVRESQYVIMGMPYSSKTEHHEDTYFSYYLTDLANSNGIFEAATKFSVEWHYYPKPFGIHDVEDHLSQKLVEKILKNSDIVLRPLKE